MTSPRLVVPTLLGLALALPTSAQTQIPVRHLTPAAAVDSGVIGLLLGVRPLPDGHVMVNDPVRHRLVIFDSTLKHFTVAAGTDAGAPQLYWAVPGAIFPYLGDSTVFVDQESQTFIIIDASGKVVRATAPPKAADVSLMMGAAAVGPPQGFDLMGRVIYHAFRRPQRAPPQRGGPIDSGKVTLKISYDSSAVLRGDPETRRVDTIAFLSQGAAKIVSTSMGGGRSMDLHAENPLPSADQWALLSDGTAAIVRVADYHIDWIHPDGATSSTPKMPFDWRRVADEDKQRMIDSAHKAFDARVAAAPPAPPPLPPGARGGATLYSGSSMPQLNKFVSVDPSEMPDYYPPVRGGSVRADRDGNLWVVPTTSTAAGNGLVYDVINRQGQVFERVQLPPGRNIIAFGQGGVVFMISQWGPRAPRLERARIIR